MIPPNKEYKTRVSSPGGAGQIAVFVNGQSVVATVTHISGDEYEITVSKSNVVCDGQNDGSLKVEVNGNSVVTEVIGPCC